MGNNAGSMLIACCGRGRWYVEICERVVQGMGSRNNIEMTEELIKEYCKKA